TAASRMRRRLSSWPGDRSVNLRSIVQPLAGTLVVDFTRYLPGPFASRELLQRGARVVRVETPEGDPLRAVAPGWDVALNAGKESVAWPPVQVADLAGGALACYRIYETADRRFLTVTPPCLGEHTDAWRASIEG